MRRFGVMPFLYCERGEVCHYASRNDRSYWLTTLRPLLTMPMAAADMQEFISRCTVCESRSNVIAVHSYTKSARDIECPNGWERMWEGYSFLMVSPFKTSGLTQKMREGVLEVWLLVFSSPKISY